jgi:hypothetical protein
MEDNNFREPIPTIPDPPVQRPSESRNITPDSTLIPAQIKLLVQKVLGWRGDVFVRKIATEPFSVSDYYNFVPGGTLPIVSVSRLIFTDGAVSSSEVILEEPQILANKSVTYLPKKRRISPHAVSQSISNQISGANYIAIINHSPDFDEPAISYETMLEIYAREPRRVIDFVRALRRKSSPDLEQFELFKDSTER